MQEKNSQISEKKIVSVHGTLKLENRNWKFGLDAFVDPIQFWAEFFNYCFERLPLIKVLQEIT